MHDMNLYLTRTKEVLKRGASLSKDVSAPITLPNSSTLLLKHSTYVGHSTQHRVENIVSLNNARFGDNSYYNYGSYDLRPGKAIDGDKKGTGTKGFAHSRSSTSPSNSFHVDLVYPEKLDNIIIFPRKDCCFDRYDSMRVYINKNVECEKLQVYNQQYVKAHLNDGLKFNCPQNLIAENIIITNGKDHLQIAELNAYRAEPAVKLSGARFGDNSYYDFGNWDLKPEYAIDGFVKAVNHLKSFAHSRASKSPHNNFYVNIDNPTQLNKVLIYPRRDCCWERYASTRVYINSQGVNGKDGENVECHKKQSHTEKYVKDNLNRGLDFYCPETVIATGISIIGGNSHLQLAEVVAEKINFQAKLSNARFSDNVYYKDSYWNLHPKYAIDGRVKSNNKPTSFAHSKNSKEFYVDLDVPSEISHVVIYPRRDCCWDRYTSTAVYLLPLSKECTRKSNNDATFVKNNLDKGLYFVCPENFKAESIMVVNANYNQPLQIAEIVAYRTVIPPAELESGENGSTEMSYFSFGSYGFNVARMENEAKINVEDGRTNAIFDLIPGTIPGSVIIKMKNHNLCVDIFYAWLPEHLSGNQIKQIQLFRCKQSSDHDSNLNQLWKIIDLRDHENGLNKGKITGKLVKVRSLLDKRYVLHVNKENNKVELRIEDNSKIDEQALTLHTKVGFSNSNSNSLPINYYETNDEYCFLNDPATRDEIAKKENTNKLKSETIASNGKYYCARRNSFFNNFIETPDVCRLEINGNVYDKTSSTYGLGNSPFVINKNDNIYRGVASSDTGKAQSIKWTKLNGLLKDIGCNSDLICWGVNVHGDVYYTDASSVSSSYVSWVKKHASFKGKSISTGRDGAVWVTDSNHRIWRANSIDSLDSWSEVHGRLTDVAVINYDKAWGVNKESDLWYHDGHIWTKFKTGFKKVAVCETDDIYAVATNGDIWWYTASKGWEKFDGWAADIACKNNRAYVIGRSGTIWVRAEFDSNRGTYWNRINGEAVRIG